MNLNFVIIGIESPLFGVSLGELVTGIVSLVASMILFIAFAVVDKYKSTFLGAGMASLSAGIIVVFKVVAVYCYRRYILQRPH